MENIYCEHCGAENKANAKYCCQCGFKLETRVSTEPSIIPEKPKRKPGKLNGQTIVGVIVSVLAAGLASWGVQQFLFKSSSFEKQLTKAVSEINKHCPVLVDSETQLDNAFSLGDSVLQYNYTLIHLTREQMVPDTLDKYLKPKIINTVKTSPELKPYRDHKVTLVYNYKDKGGVFVYKLAVRPNMY